MGYAINTTNKQNNEHMVIYCSLADESKIFVREVKEFHEKFEAMNMGNSRVS